MDGGEFISEYENQQIAAIRAWKHEEPGVVSKTFGLVAAPVVWLVQRVVPDSAIRGALDGANWIARHTADTPDILRDGRVSSVAELKSARLETCDVLADSVHNWAIGIASAEGAATGAGGLPGLLVDVPAVITLALRTIHKIGLCYGYECHDEHDQNFILGVLAASGANSMQEKLAALATLRTIEVIIAKQTWKAMQEKAATMLLSKESAIIAVRQLAKQLGVNLTKRKALQAIPAIGAFVGASVNGWYIKEVGWAARRAFQERWLVDNRKLLDI